MGLTTKATDTIGQTTTSEVVNVTVAADKDYYAIVKGVDTGNHGDYELKLTDMDAITGQAFDCGAGVGDPTARDAFFYFTLKGIFT